MPCHSIQAGWLGQEDRFWDRIWFSWHARLQDRLYFYYPGKTVPFIHPRAAFLLFPHFPFLPNLCCVGTLNILQACVDSSFLTTTTTPFYLPYYFLYLIPPIIYTFPLPSPHLSQYSASYLPTPSHCVHAFLHFLPLPTYFIASGHLPASCLPLP